MGGRFREVGKAKWVKNGAEKIYRRRGTLINRRIVSRFEKGDQMSIDTFVTRFIATLIYIAVLLTFFPDNALACSCAGSEPKEELERGGRCILRDSS